MASLTTPICNFGEKAHDFRLLNVDGRYYSLEELKGEKGTLIAFICNHCPYVKAIRERLIRDAKDLAKLGINTIAINSNDATTYPEDSFEVMQAVAARYDYPFAYLYDETQAVAKAYGAVCTPDFFGYNADLELQYRGRLDESRKETAPEGVRRDLYEAMKQVAETGHGPKEQIPSIGCSIKWKDES